MALGAASAWGQVDVSGWPQVRMNVMALDAQGDPIAGLTANSVVVSEDKALANKVVLAPDAEPQSICLLIDSSGSMYDRRDAVKAAAMRLLESLPAKDEVCLTDFAVEAYVDQDLTADRALDRRALGVLRASGGTALRDAVIVTSGYLRKTAKNRSRAIIVVSDGEDNASKAGEDELTQEMQKNGAPVVEVVCVPSSESRGCGNEKAALRLAGATGGSAYFPRSAAEVNGAVDHLTAALAARYILTYEPPVTARDGGWRRVDVSLDKAHAMKKAVVLAPAGYYAPAY